MSSKSSAYQFHFHPVLIVGAGGAGLRAAVAVAEKGVKVGVLSKVPPTRSHTVAAQGGINAALGNVTPDDWRWHMYDTIRGSDWLGDQDAIAYMCKQAPTAIYDLEKMGVAFSRDDQGKIYQRAYGGMSTHFGKGDLAFRACAAADRTGDALMTGLYDYVKHYDVDFFVEYIALDLLMTDDGACRGVLAWELETGGLHVFLAHEVILATGGYGQVYASATSSSTCTGDGNAMVLRAGLPLADMEFVQFHPTGLYGTGILISEAARGEGGFLLNGEGERFMERYAPKYKDLASRDVVTRSIVKEIAEGRGAGAKKDHVLLDIRHLPEEIIDKQLPGTRSIAGQFAHVDVLNEPIPVVPTAHYCMGGIPATRECEVLGRDERIVPGLYAVGEAACNSVHGANRLGCNSLLDLVVFGKHSGEVAASRAEASILTESDIPKISLEKALTHFASFSTANGTLAPTSIRQNVRAIMQESAGIIREEKSMSAGLTKLEQVASHFEGSFHIGTEGLAWNNLLVAAIETENLLLQGIATLASARFRTESRGAHYRSDCPHRDDNHWLAHTIVEVDNSGKPKCYTRSVRFNTGVADAGTVQPETRVY